jgi:hypothetical protein
MERCVFCRGLLLRGENICPDCGRAQPTGEGNYPAQVVESYGPVMGQCPNCGASISAWEPVCSACGVPLGAPGEANQAASIEAGTDSSGALADQPALAGAEDAPGLAAMGATPFMEAATEPGMMLAPELSAPLGGAEPPDGAAAPTLASEVVFSRAPADQQESAVSDEELPTLAGQSGVTPTGFPAAAPSIGMLPPPPRKRWLKPLSLALAVLLVLGGISAAAYIFTRPRPVIQVTGPAQSGPVPTGSADLAFHVTGTDFSADSAITFLLDGKPAPDAPALKSDSNGSFATDLPITDNWLIGQHMLTARDASDYVTRTGVSVLVQAAPVIAIVSSYEQGQVPAGSPGTFFEIKGKRFSLKTSVTILLDGAPVETISSADSDEKGVVQTSVQVDDSWQIGQHTFTAKDAQGYSTKAGTPVVVVHQGEAGTPGPNGSPADNASFSVVLNVSGKDSAGQTFAFEQFLQITGHPDPAGGTVCSPNDDGKPHTYTGTLSNTRESYTETLILGCSGTYKKGHLTYIEKVISDVLVLGSGVKCTLRGTAIYGAYDGTFTSARTISGVYFSSYYQLPCTDRGFVYYNSSQGTWTGTF